MGAYAEDGYRSVADVVDPASLQKVRDHKKGDEGPRRAALADTHSPGSAVGSKPASNAWHNGRCGC